MLTKKGMQNLKNEKFLHDGTTSNTTIEDDQGDQRNCSIQDRKSMPHVGTKRGFTGTLWTEYQATPVSTATVWFRCKVLCSYFGEREAKRINL